MLLPLINFMLFSKIIANDIHLELTYHSKINKLTAIIIFDLSQPIQRGKSIKIFSLSKNVVVITKHVESIVFRQEKVAFPL